MLLRFLLLLGLAACTAPIKESSAPTDFQTTDLWSAHWQEDRQAYAKILEEFRWEISGSIEAERYRQSHQIRLGKRAQVYEEAAEQLSAHPNSADAHYLFARLLQDPIRLAHQFSQLAERWPAHGWIRLGAAGSQQSLGNFSEAAEHLKHAPDWPDAREFRNLLIARQAFAQNRKEPWRPILQDALLDGNPAALLELQFQARQLDKKSILRVAKAEFALRKSNLADERACLEGLLERALAELASNQSQDLSALLDRMDEWSTRLNLANGWQNAARYSLPFGLAYLLHPEQQSTELGALLARNQKALILGSAFGQKPLLLVLQNVHRLKISWPGSAQPIEILLAGSGQSSDGNWFGGAALFRGFYARRDVSNRIAQIESSRLQGIDSANLGLDRAILPLTDPGNAAPGRLPEDLDLPIRLRFQALNGNLGEVENLQWQTLLLHESGHLPDVLPWTEGRGSIWEGLSRSIYSWMRDGMVLGEWEYRAQLRALASGLHMRWTLADIVQISRNPKEPYFKPYRRLLTDLVFLARRQGLPELASWHLLSDPQLAKLAGTLCEQADIQTLPEASMQDLLQQVDCLQNL